MPEYEINYVSVYILGWHVITHDCYCMGRSMVDLSVCIIDFSWKIWRTCVFTNIDTPCVGIDWEVLWAGIFLMWKVSFLYSCSKDGHSKGQESLILIWLRRQEDDYAARRGDNKCNHEEHLKLLMNEKFPFTLRITTETYPGVTICLLKMYIIHRGNISQMS